MDFINIDVGYAITPAESEVTLGDVTCLRSSLVTPNGHAGTWHAQSDGVVRLDAASGVAVATQVSSTVVSYNLTSSSATHTQVSEIM